MRKPLTLIAWSFAVALATTPLLAGGNANFVVGVRSVDTGEEGFSDIEDQGAIGANVDFHTGDLPFSWVVGFHVSGKEEDVDLGGGFDGDLSFGLAELSFGLGWIWEAGNARPYVGGGVTLVSAAVELDVPGIDFDEDDSSGALYGDGGVSWRLGEVFNLGVGGRFVVGTDFDIGGENIDADYAQIHGVIGWGWD